MLGLSAQKRLLRILNISIYVSVSIIILESSIFDFITDWIICSPSNKTLNLKTKTDKEKKLVLTGRGGQLPHEMGRPPVLPTSTQRLDDHLHIEFL